MTSIIITTTTKGPCHNEHQPHEGDVQQKQQTTFQIRQIGNCWQLWINRYGVVIVIIIIIVIFLKYFLVIIIFL